MTEDLTKLTLDQIKENLKKLTPAQIEAFKFALSIENENLFNKKIEEFKEQENQKFSDSMGSYRASSEEKKDFQEKLSQYTIYIENTHRSFFSKDPKKQPNCEKNPNGQLKFRNGRILREFYTWLVLAGIANTEFTKFKKEFNDRVRDVSSERSAQADRNARKNNRRLKGLGAILAAGALGTAAVFGTKAVMEKFENSEDDDAKTDRIEHRVNIPKTTVQQRGYVQDAYEEVVIQDEVRHQTEEFRQPQKVIETVVVEKEVPQVIEKTVVVEKEVPVPVPVPQPTIEQQVEANTVAYQTAMGTAPTTYVQLPSNEQNLQFTQLPPTPTTYPNVTVINNDSSVADFVGAAAGALVGQVVADRLDGRGRGHHRIGHGAPPPVSFGGRNCGPNRTVRAPRVSGPRNCGPSHTVRAPRVQRSGNCGPNIKRGGHPRVIGGPAIVPTARRHSMRGTMQRHQTIRPNQGGHHRPTGGNRGGRPSGGRGGRGGRR